MSRILLVTTEYPPATGGIGTYCAQIAAAAAANGHEVTVLAPDYGRSHDDPVEAGAPRILRYPGANYTVRNFPSLLTQINRHADPKRYDIIHAIDWPSGLVLGFINRFRRVPYRVTVHGTEILLMPDSRQIKLLGGNFFSAPDIILTNSHFTKSLLLEKFPAVDPERAKVTLLGVGEYWFEPAENPEAALTPVRSARSARTCILTVGRLDERKGHRLVFQALVAASPRGRRELRLRGGRHRGRGVHGRAQGARRGIAGDDGLHRTDRQRRPARALRLLGGVLHAG